MAFDVVQLENIKIGGKKMVWGTFDSNATTGGNITLPIDTVESFDLQLGATSTVSTEPTINETLPLRNAGVVTVVCTAGALGWYCAIGK